jgi:hypothetical protein
MSKKRSWIVSRLGALLEVLHSPASGYTRELGGPSFLVPLAVFGALSVWLFLLQSPIQHEWVAQQMKASGASPAEIAPHLEALRRHQPIGGAIVPLVLLLKWIALASLLWLSAQLILERDVEFGPVLGVVAYGYAPLLLRDACIYLVLALRDPDVLARRNGLDVAIGLNLVFPSLELPWSTLLANVNLFEIWYAALLVVGLSKVGSAPWRRSAAVVLPNWLLVVLFQVGLASAGMRMQASMGS